MSRQPIAELLTSLSARLPEAIEIVALKIAGQVEVNTS